MSGHAKHVLAELASGTLNSDAITDAAAWVAMRSGADLLIQQQIEPPPRFVPTGDFNGAIWMGPTGAMLNEVGLQDRLNYTQKRKVDEQRLLAAQRRAESLVGRPVEARLISEDAGSATDPMLLVCAGPERKPMGRRPRLDPCLQRELRKSACPVLLAPRGDFAAPEQLVIAFDGSHQAYDRVERLSASLWLAGLPILLAMAGAVSPAAHEQLLQARERLRAAGFSVETALLQGPPVRAIAGLLLIERRSLLVMGAYGGSRLRRWARGSTTAALLLTSSVPVLIQR